MTTLVPFVEQPHWFLIVRIIQAILALITVGLSGYASSVWGVFSGYGLDFWTFIYTAAFLAYWFFVARRVRAAWNITWLYFGAELFVCFWWLVTFALLASEATLLDDYDTYFDNDDGSIFGTAGSAALGCTKGAAVGGAIEFVLFCVTLGFFVPAMLRAHRIAGTGQYPPAKYEQNNYPQGGYQGQQGGYPQQGGYQQQQGGYPQGPIQSA